MQLLAQMFDGVAITRLGRRERNLQNLGDLRKGASAMEMKPHDLALLLAECRHQPLDKSLLLLEIRGIKLLGQNARQSLNTNKLTSLATPQVLRAGIRQCAIEITTRIARSAHFAPKKSQIQLVNQVPSLGPIAKAIAGVAIHRLQFAGYEPINQLAVVTRWVIKMIHTFEFLVFRKTRFQI